VIVVKLVLLLRDQSDIFVIPLPKTIDDNKLNSPRQYRLVKASGIVKLVIGHPLNGAQPVLIMETGSVTLVKPHPLNAYSPIVAMLLGLAKVTLARAEHALNA
jgi:hypothetical protein